MDLVIKKAVLNIIKEGRTVGRIIIASGIHYEERLIEKDKEEILQLHREGGHNIVCTEEWERDMLPQEPADRPKSRERAAMELCAANGIRNVFLIDGDITEVYKKSRYFRKKDGDLSVAFHYGFANVATSTLFGEDKFDLYELIKQIANYIVLLRNTNLKREDLLTLNPRSEIAARALEDTNLFLQPLYRSGIKNFREIEERFETTHDASVFVLNGTPDNLHRKFMAISNHLMSVMNEIMAERINEIFREHFDSVPTIYVVLEHDHYNPVKKRIINMLTKLRFRIQTSEQTRGVVTVRDD